MSVIIRSLKFKVFFFKRAEAVPGMWVFFSFSKDPNYGFSFFFFFSNLWSCTNIPNFLHLVKFTSISPYGWQLKARVFQKAARTRRSCDDSQVLHGNPFLPRSLLQAGPSWVGSWVPGPRMTCWSSPQQPLLPCFLPGNDRGGSVVAEPARSRCWCLACKKGQHLYSGEFCAAWQPQIGTSSLLDFWPTYFQGLLSRSVCYLLSQGMVGTWERFSCLQ